MEGMTVEQLMMLGFAYEKTVQLEQKGKNIFIREQSEIIIQWVRSAVERNEWSCNIENYVEEHIQKQTYQDSVGHNQKPCSVPCNGEL